MSERELQTQIECPRCTEVLPESPSDSILASLRCTSCGHMLAFDEVLALRDAERVRSRKYE